MQMVILSFDSNVIIIKYEWWWWLNDREYTKISIGSKVFEWFIPQYANQNSLNNFCKIPTIAFWWKNVTDNWFLDISISGTRHRNQALLTENFYSV